MTGYNLPPGVETYMIPGNQSDVTRDNTHINTWFERDRAYVGLEYNDTDETIIEFWDSDVSELVEDGFLDPSDWHGSMVEYYRHLNGG